MTDICLHVGPVKTGSTFLQGVLWRHRADLTRQGILLPGESKSDIWLAANDVQDCEFIHFALPAAPGSWDRLRDRVLAFGGLSLISHEILGMSTPDQVSRIATSLRPARLHVVVMARSLADSLPSLWQEGLKRAGQNMISWPDFLRAQRDARAPVTDATLIVSRWLAHVPPGRLHVVIVPPPNRDRRILLERFAAAAGFDASGWDADGLPVNESLDSVQAELVRRLNMVAAGSWHTGTWPELLSQVVLPGLRRSGARPERRLRVPASERAWIEAETARRVEELKASHAVVHGEIADLHAGPASWEDEPQPPGDGDLLAEALLLLASPPRSGPVIG
ncbi:MAG TPA: hypothetical protein VGI64_22680 [Streptosporangiaceae bacterium]